MFVAFGLKFEFINDRSTRVYTKLRWQQEGERKSGKDKSPAQGSSVRAFLNDMCVKSSFSKDYIMLSDLRKKYDLYCSNYSYTGVNQ